MDECNARYGGPSSGFNYARRDARRNGISDSDEESDGGYPASARGDYDDVDGAELRRAMYNADSRESHRGSAARARGGARGGHGGHGGRGGGRGGGSGGAHGGAHGGANGHPYHGVEAFTTDDEDSDSGPAPRGVTRVHRRRGEGVRREEAHFGSRREHGGGGRGGTMDPRDGSFHAPDARFSRDGTMQSRGGMMNHSRGGTMMHSHHHHGHDERADQGPYDSSSDDDRMRARRRHGLQDDSSEEEVGDSEDAITHAFRAAAGHGDRYGGPSRRY